jgi:chemotaxis protein CheD
VWEPIARIAGLLHFLLPDSKINPARARLEPEAFADSGIPRLFHDVYRLGGQKKRCTVRLVGGAEISGHAPDGVLNVGRRNILAARGILWRNGVMVEGEAVGGTTARSVILAAATGVLTIKANGGVTEL